MGAYSKSPKQHTYSALIDFQGKRSPTLTCKQRNWENKGRQCGAPLVWHEYLQQYYCCTNKRCVNYYKCQCGREFGEHVKALGV